MSHHRVDGFLGNRGDGTAIGVPLDGDGAPAHSGTDACLRRQTPSMLMIHVTATQRVYFIRSNTTFVLCQCHNTTRTNNLAPIIRLCPQFRSPNHIVFFNVVIQ